VTPGVGGFTDVINYEYDQAWALKRVIHNADTTDYAYNATTGDLTSVTVRLGITGSAAARTRTFTYLWDGLGRLKQITYPAVSGNSMKVFYRYDAAGILRRLTSTNPVVSANDAFDFVLRNTSVDAVGRILSQELSCPAGSSVLGNPCGTVNSQSTLVTTVNKYDRMSWLRVQDRNGWIDSMRYDGSGNLTYKKEGSSALRHFFTTDTLHNQLKRDSVVGLAPLVITYDANGNRDHEIGNVSDQREKIYYYDGLGRMSGTQAWVGLDVRNRPNDCAYNADGVMAAACDNAPWLALDGDNVSGTLLAGGKGWTFFHGPGLDSPLMGYYRPSTGSSRVLYWVTDGAGRQVAVADSSGKRQSNDDVGGQKDWRQAGGTGNSFGFGADRQTNPNLSGLSFFRNRVYDQNTGRWLQEDPVGVAGGLNLYQFNGNNPAAYTDPFGLCPIPPSACGPLIGVAVRALAGIVITAAATKALQDMGEARHRELIPASGPRPTAGEQEQINELGEREGCMTCGATNPGTKSGNWVGNHIPPTSVAIPGEPQQYGPHCLTCSNKQGGWLRQLLRKVQDAVTGGGPSGPALPAGAVTVDPDERG
jgi:RHS repeat-associated protein